MEGMYRFSCGGAYSAHGNTAMPLADQICGEPVNKADFMSAVLAANNGTNNVPRSHVAPFNTPMQFGDAFDVAVFGAALAGILLFCIGGCFMVSWWTQSAPHAVQPVSQSMPAQFAQPASDMTASTALVPSQYQASVGIPAGITTAPVAAMQYGQPFAVSTGAALAPAAALHYYQPAVVAALPKIAYGQPEAQPIQQPAQQMVHQATHPVNQVSAQISNPPAALGTMTTRTGYDAMGRVHTNAFR